MPLTLLALVATAAGVAAAALLGAGGSPLLSLDRDEVFPHPEHDGLFPSCLGCHAGVPAGEAARYYTVAEADCATCHDGVREERVAWRDPPGVVTNLRFSHPEHAERVAEAAETGLDCQACHLAAGSESRMEVTLASSEACLGCHAEREGRTRPDHLARETVCAACHRPLAEATGLPPFRIAAFPEPPGHRDGSFLLEHGASARQAIERCSVCHARESCARCHLNADRLDPVVALAADDRVAGLVAEADGEWPEPASHRRADFALAHGDLAREAIGSCANCHARPSCATCHGAPGPPWIASLPRPVEGGPAGVTVDAVRPPGHDAAFSTDHGSAAASEMPRCSSCHRETECAECHDRALAGTPPHGHPRASPPAPDAVAGRSTPAEADGDPPGRTPATGRRPAATAESRLGPLGDLPAPGTGFHPPNFVLRHGAEAFAAPTECAECHSREAFCRSCHERSGFAATRQRTSGAFHDGQADWLLVHGQAARQNLEGCVGCHRQTSCLRCHSARAGLRVSPHGPGVDARRMADRSTISCGVCHFADILPP